MKGQIVAVFSCCGKTHFVLNKFSYISCVDHDMYDWMYRGQLGKTWIDYYLVRTLELQEKFDYVFVNAIPEIINRLPKFYGDSIVVYPKRELRQEFVKRAKSRGGMTSFPKMLDDKWDEWISACENWSGSFYNWKAAST